jgi:tetratricopeptide (TPR) repeat protein
MKSTLLLTLNVLILFSGFSQSTQTYTGENGDIHLCGSFSIETLFSDTTYADWYEKGYSAESFLKTKPKWAKNLKDVQVKIYLGTWCGDSKKWVPRFVKLWDEAGLERSQLDFIAVYDSDVEGKYKQGPAGETQGKMIHRVPTFIFEKEGKEMARIVESPVNDLTTDVAQIALGYPSEPNYRGATYLLKLMQEFTLEEINESYSEHLIQVYYAQQRQSELNTLGYVLLDAGKVDEALMVFEMNTKFYPFEPNVYDSYGEALEKSGKKLEAIEVYKKVRLLDRSHEHASERIRALSKG